VKSIENFKYKNFINVNLYLIVMVNEPQSQLVKEGEWVTLLKSNIELTSAN